MSIRRIIGFLLLCSIPAAGFAETSSLDVRAWLNRMAQAVRTLNYEGTFVYQHGNELETMRIYHKMDEKGERERLISLNGTAREVIRDNNFVTCILPDTKSVVVDKSRPNRSFSTSLPERFDDIEKYYAFTVGQQDRIAGRSAQVIMIKPLDEYRYGYRLWVDIESGLLLKHDQINEQGIPIEQIMFTEIRILDTLDDSLLKPATSGKEFTWYTEDSKAGLHMTVDKSWKVRSMPRGFMMAHHNKHRVPSNVMPVNHMVYTDGLAWVSVFIERLIPDKQNLDGVSHMGAANAFGLVVSDHHVTVVGEVPAATVRLIGNSVIYAADRDGLNQ